MVDAAHIALARAASTLFAAARAHKRAEAHHRRQARELMVEFDRVKQACEQAGIRIEIQDMAPKEAQSHGREHPRSVDDR